MDATIRTYLDLLAIEAVGEALLDPRPAFVAAGDGTRLLWANSSAAGFFGKRTIGELLAWRPSALNPLKAQIARLARVLPADALRVEILRIGFGVSLTALPAACRRLNLADGTSAVMVIAASSVGGGSLTARAERLVEAMADGGYAVAVIASGGRLLAASADYYARTKTRGAIDNVVARADLGDRIVDRPIAVVGDVNGARAVGFRADGHRCFLVLARPGEVEGGLGEPSAAAAEEPSPEIASEPPLTPEISLPPPETVVEPTVVTPVRRFTWACDSAGRFTFVSSQLAEAVGSGNAAVVGTTWAKVASVLDLDPENRAGSALAANAPWNATVYWPVAGTGERIAVDLSAMPVAEAGFRGFGVCRPDDRLRDDRPRPTLADALRVGLAPEHGGDASVASDAEFDDAARRRVEEGPSPEMPAATEAPEEAAASNVVRLPGALAPSAVAGERLSGSEQDAFRRIAEALAASRAKPARVKTDADTTPGEVEISAAAGPSVAIDFRILDRIPVGLAVMRNHEVLFANRALLDLVGDDTFEQFVAAGGLDAIFPDRPAGWGGERATGVGSLTARRRDGMYVPVAVRLNTVQWGPANALMLTISPRRGQAGEAQGATAQAAAEAEVAELRAILDTATDGVIVIDRAGVISSMNRAAEALFGVEADDLVGKSITDLMAEESGKPALDYLDGLATNGVASVLNDGREVIGKVPQGGLIPLFMTMGRIGEL